MSNVLELMELLSAVEHRIAACDPGGSRGRGDGLRAARNFVAAARRQLRDHVLTLDERVAGRAP